MDIKFIEMPENEKKKKPETCILPPEKNPINTTSPLSFMEGKLVPVKVLPSIMSPPSNNKLVGVKIPAPPEKNA